MSSPSGGPTGRPERPEPPGAPAGAGRPERPGRFGRTFESLRVRNFRLFFCGQLISNTGNWLANIVGESSARAPSRAGQLRRRAS